MTDICEFLNNHGIPFQDFYHPAVATCEEAKLHLGDIGGMATKNLFLRNKKGDRHYLVSIPEEKQANLQALGQVLGSGRLSFGSPERLNKYLGLTPGSVTLLGIINDVNHAVDIIIDEAIWEAPSIQCHPLINTATLVIPQAGIRAFFTALGRSPAIMCVPS